VEIARRQLESWLSGRRIVAARAPKSRVLRTQSPLRFAQLKGRRLQEIDRVGKWMLLKFDGGEGLISHLGMTGKWIRRRKGEQPASHVRATIELSDGHAVDYRDPRLFGLLLRGKVEQLRRLPSFSGLGPGREVDAAQVRRRRGADLAPRHDREVDSPAQGRAAGIARARDDRALRRPRGRLSRPAPVRAPPARKGRTITATSVVQRAGTGSGSGCCSSSTAARG